MSTIAQGIADFLKAQTRDLHAAAEGHDFQRRLLKGTLPLPAYAMLHGQYWMIHEAIEAHLAELRGTNGPFTSLLRDHHFRAPLFARDLNDLAMCCSTLAPLAVTQHFINSLERAAKETPLLLLGVLYVLEGSTNGSQYIAMAANRAFDLGGRGIAALNPHGELQRARWQQFRASLDALDLDSEGQRLVLEGALATFQYAIDMMDAVDGACG